MFGKHAIKLGACCREWGKHLENCTVRNPEPLLTELATAKRGRRRLLPPSQGSRVRANES